MKIKDKPNFKTKEKPITFFAQDHVDKALKIMSEKNIGSIVVVDNDEKVIGIVTERDMLIRVLYAKIEPEKTTLSEIMSNKVKTAREEDDVIDWLHTMSNERFRHLPVVNDEGKIINMMSQGDFVAHTWPDLYENAKNNIKGRLARSLQIVLVLFAIITLGFLVFKL